jgi:hypothetical protein
MGRNCGLGPSRGHGRAGRAGRSNAGFRPMELMLLGLGFCMGYDMVMILRRMRKEVSGYRIHDREKDRRTPTVHTEVTLEHVVTGKGISRNLWNGRWSWPNTNTARPRPCSPRRRPMHTGSRKP